VRKSTFTLFAILLCCFVGTAQVTDDEDYVPGKQVGPDSKDTPWRLRDNLFYGGGFGLGFSNGWSLNISPQIGVKANRFLGAGVGFDYTYFGSSVGNIQIAAPSVFARGKILERLLLQTEFQYLTYKDQYLGDVNRFSAPMWLAGIGYQDGGSGGGFFVMALWDLIQDPYNPIPMPIFRAGISIGF
jgi:hypothetical protein